MSRNIVWWWDVSMVHYVKIDQKHMNYVGTYLKFKELEDRKWLGPITLPSYWRFV